MLRCAVPLRGDGVQAHAPRTVQPRRSRAVLAVTARSSPTPKDARPVTTQIAVPARCVRTHGFASPLFSTGWRREVSSLLQQLFSQPLTHPQPGRVPPPARLPDAARGARVRRGHPGRSERGQPAAVNRLPHAALVRPAGHLARPGAAAASAAAAAAAAALANKLSRASTSSLPELLAQAEALQRRIADAAVSSDERTKLSLAEEGARLAAKQAAAAAAAGLLPLS